MRYNATYVVKYFSVGSVWVGFDDAEVVKIKVAYAKQKKFVGYFVWEVSYDDNWELSLAAAGPNLQVFTLAEIEAATGELSIENKLGKGGYGPVYKGELPNGQEIAVKKLSKTSTQGFEEFKNEVVLTAKLQHVNLVRLLGFCTERNEQMLIYEYMPNKSLDFYLFDASKSFILDWRRRIDIIEGITQGHLYLQEYSRMTIIHRDIKASNILLDEEMKPKISDFGMARTFMKHEHEANTDHRIVGTSGYVPPEYVKRVSTPPNLMFIALESCFYKSLVEREMPITMFSQLKGAKDKPSMLEVSSMLKNESKALTIPKKPAFSRKTDEDQLEDKPILQQEICSDNFATISELKENEELKRQHVATPPVNNEQTEGDAHSASGVNAEELGKRKLHNQLKNFIDKYEEMSRKMGGSSFIEQLLNRTNLLYNDEVMAITLSSKFKIPQVDIYDGSRDPVDHLKNFKAHITLHDFPGEVA
ncbi:G-type lectin S-receptor-like serine/threonine-protein kinase At1g67520 [Carya illinoinensis]|uniref:G-type lectin S-receptor-like serine/threonine-protein kinase At1g67520 n=1 Tax=Carya illinoinensis TaxID=32201 RepID=UPI001C7186C5|nr:G-type lectin S-receptor-like serine/threonine-protein kinase At1g67520 [Carya illinoinensis]